MRKAVQARKALPGAEARGSPLLAALPKVCLDLLSIIESLLVEQVNVVNSVLICQCRVLIDGSFISWDGAEWG